MNVWIPKKSELEILLQDILDKLKSANEVSDVEEWIDDALVLLECHVSNRASVERGEISEAHKELHADRKAGHFWNKLKSLVGFPGR